MPGMGMMPGMTPPGSIPPQGVQPNPAQATNQAGQPAPGPQPQSPHLGGVEQASKNEIEEAFDD